jgi:hypothetical protein
MTEKEIKPWYREPWPWIIMGSIGFVMLACFVTLGIAIWSYDGLVADDYYKKGKAINKVLAREERSAALGLGALLTMQSDDTLRVVLQSSATTFEPPEVLQLHMVHPRYPDQDKRATLVHVKNGIYNAHFVPPVGGGWKIVLEGGDWRLPILNVQAPITEVRWEPPAAAF